MNNDTGINLSAEVYAAHDRGWALTILDGKKPSRGGWQSEEPMSIDALIAHTNQGRNIGLRTGSISGVYVIDCDNGADVGALNLPDTVTVHTGGGGEHYYYAMPDTPLGNTAGTLAPHIDTRGDGGQVVYPGSVHPETHGLYQWAPDHSPEDIEIAPLPQWILAQLTGTKPDSTPRQRRDIQSPNTNDKYVDAALQRGIEAVRTAPKGQRNATLNREAYALAGLPIDPSDLEGALVAAACEAGLAEKEARKTCGQAIRKGQAAPRTVPDRPASRNNGNGTAKTPDGPHPGAPPPNKHLIPADEPLRFAEAVLDHCFTHGGVPTIRNWQDEWWLWTGTHYTKLGKNALCSTVYKFLDDCLVPDTKDEWRKPKHTIAKNKEVREALVAVNNVIVPDDTEAPTWLDSTVAPTTGPVLPCRNGIVDLSTKQLHEHSPSHLNTFALPFQYDAKAPEPVEWLAFLDSLWADAECVSLLREWFGYCISQDTAYQKMLLLIGPKRSGKGTIARVLQALMGASNVASPTLASLAENFGLQSLIGKPLAVVADARLSGRSDQAQVVERLLSVSGEDHQTIPRKFLADWHGKLPTRFVIVSNELPRLSDTSGALASRFLVLPTERSFYGHEDRTLFRRLAAELPGILNWAIDGWANLESAGRFTAPEASSDMTEMLGDVTSPIGQFLTDRCVIDPAVCVPVDTMYRAWQMWCKEQGRDHPGTVQSFGRDLRAACPSVKTRHPRISGGRERVYDGIRLDSQW